VKVAKTDSGLVATCKVYASALTKTTLKLHSTEGKVNLIHECTLYPGEQRIEIPFEQTALRYWNPLHRGEQQLYSYQLSVVGDTTSVHCTTGFRTAELIQQPDSIGDSFGFRINGKDVFARGANIIPPHVFLNAVTTADYEKIVKSAADANCNMLRVWGGGVYLPDIFYELCDRYGIMVWQDFMFACSMIPGNKEFQQSVETEALQQMERLSSHPCIVLWCGNNESDEGWHNWGWQKQFSYSPQDSALIWQHYQQVFETMLPVLVAAYGNGTAYVSSSPKYGWGRKQSMTSGDSHYWGVWWGWEPFEKYREKVPRFMSEFGFQSLPDVSAWNGVVKNPTKSSPSLRHHQKHPRGFETIDTMLRQYFIVPEDLRDYSYVSQLQQAYGMKMAIDAQRSSYPYCRGSLFWQWNDCWPSISWSAMDYRYRPKLFYYEAKKLFEPFYCSAKETAKGLVAGLHYEGGPERAITMRTWFIATNNSSQPALLDERDLRIKADTVIQEAFVYPAAHLTFLDRKSNVIVTEAWDRAEQRVIGRNFLLRCKPNELKLDTATINMAVFSPGMFVLTSDVFAYGVYLYDEKGEMEFSDNGFHLIPGEQKEIFYSGADASRIRIKCLNNLLLKAETTP
jgi:beta-mannosidase